jgi:hypothetical protein
VTAKLVEMVTLTVAAVSTMKSTLVEEEAFVEVAVAATGNLEEGLVVAVAEDSSAPEAALSRAAGVAPSTIHFGVHSIRRASSARFEKFN